MKTQSSLKVFKSGKYSYLYVYYKFRKNILRIPTNEKYIKGKMTKELLFNSTVMDCEEKNDKIQKLKIEVDKYIQSKIFSSVPNINQKDCINFLRNSKDKSIKQIIINRSKVPSLVDRINEYIIYRKGTNTKYNTLKEYTTLLNRVKDFEKFTNKIVYLKDMNMLWSDTFERYLVSKPYCLGTIEKTYTILTTVLYYFDQRRNSLNVDMCDDFKIKGFKRGEKSRNQANPLTKIQLLTLFKHDFSEENFKKTKTLFCLQCSTGLRFSDITRITFDHIHGNKIVIKPKKTEYKNKVAEIPLNPISKTILQSLNYNTSVLQIANAYYNRCIKLMFKKIQEIYPSLGFKNNYTSHCGRDTFISILVQEKVDFKTILEFTGQSSYSVMDRYIKPTDEYKEAQMEKSFRDREELNE